MTSAVAELDPELAVRLPAVVARFTGPVERIEDLVPLSGGASRDTWSLRARLSSGETVELVLQRRRTVSVDSGLTVPVEAALLRAAHAAGVPVARLIGADETGDALGAPFLLVERIAGESIPQRILRDTTFASSREKLAGEYGAALARLHSIPLVQVPGIAVEEPLAHYRGVLNSIGSSHPVLELGLRWLENNRPAVSGEVLVHGDFRSGNGIVNEDGLVALIDFELAHVGDPLEDLGWFAIRAWRFGAEPAAGGFGTIDQLIAGYQSVRAVEVDRSALHWWMTFGTIRWAIMCLIQGATHLSGHRRSIELAAVGRRMSEPEFDVMLLLP